MKKIIALIAIVFVLATSTYIKTKSESITNPNESYCYLLVGLDDAAENADTIILANYSTNSNVVDFIHIPRDTLYFDGEAYCKINSIIPSLLSRGYDIKGAVEAFALTIEKSFEIKLSAYAAFTVGIIEKMVDVLGGVELNLPKDISCTDSMGATITLKKGKNRLSGREACAFLRHRKSYLLGDISRCNAQKIFLDAALSTLRSRLDLETIIRLLSLKEDVIYPNMKAKDTTKLALNFKRSISDAEIRFSNLPGTAVIVDNVSYYVINNNATENLLKKVGLLGSNGLFDSAELFNNKNDTIINEAYHSNNIQFKIYSQSEIDSIIIQ